MLLSPRPLMPTKPAAEVPPDRVIPSPAVPMNSRNDAGHDVDCAMASFVSKVEHIPKGARHEVRQAYRGGPAPDGELVRRGTQGGLRRDLADDQQVGGPREVGSGRRGVGDAALREDHPSS